MHRYCLLKRWNVLPPCSCQLFGWVGEKVKHQAVVVLVVAMMAVQGVANLQAQWAIIGEFSNLPQEELLDWIQENTRTGKNFYYWFVVFSKYIKGEQNIGL